MHYQKTVVLKDGRSCILRHADEADAEAVLAVFVLTHEQTDFLRTYPDEVSFTAADEAKYLKAKAESDREIELVAEIAGTVVGCAGIEALGNGYKTRHRAEFGVSVDAAFWGLGVGKALTAACIDCAKQAGYEQLELEVVAEKERAAALYKSLGFVEFGRNPHGFRSRLSGWQTLVNMRLELGGKTEAE